MSHNKDSIRTVLHLFRQIEKDIEACFMADPNFPGTELEELWLQEWFNDLEMLRKQLLELGCKPSDCDCRYLAEPYFQREYWSLQDR